MGMTCVKAIDITIQCKFFFIFIGLEPTYCVWVQVIFCSCVNETTLFSFLWSLWHENGRSLRWPKNTLGDQIVKQLLTSVITKYRDLSVSRRLIICLSLRLLQIIDLLATDKSRYIAQSRPVIVHYLHHAKFAHYKSWRIFIRIRSVVLILK